MRHTISFLIFLLSCFLLSAQDTILFRDGTKDVAVLEEVSTTIVRYKRFENPNGPSYVIPAENISIITYKNGTKERFSGTTEKKSEFSQTLIGGKSADKPSVPNFSGPRIGGTYIGEGTSAEWIRDHGKEPILSQFGWEFETPIFISNSGISGVAEFIPLIAGLEQGLFLPSGTVMFGLRGKEGLELAVGPTLSPEKLAIMISIGSCLRLDDIYFPINISFVPSVSTLEKTYSYTGKTGVIRKQTGFRINFTIGFNTSKKRPSR